MNLFEPTIDRNVFFIYISLLKLNGARIEDCENPYTHEEEKCVVIPIRDNCYHSKWGTVGLGVFAHPLDYPTEKRSHIVNPPYGYKQLNHDDAIIRPERHHVGYMRIMNQFNRFMK